jgi:methionyl-tRNA synthetase
VLITYLKPILPHMAAMSETFLNSEPLTFARIDTPLLDHTIQPFVPLLTRVEQANIDALLAMHTVD